MMTEKNILRLIAHIRERPLLWDVKRMKIPGILKEKARLWSHVAKLQNSSVPDIKKKWQSLKSSFYKIINKIPTNEDNIPTSPSEFKSEWKFYRPMLFLVNADTVEKTTRVKSEKRRLDTDTDSSKRRRLSEISAQGLAVDDEIVELEDESSNSNDESNAGSPDSRSNSNDGSNAWSQDSGFNPVNAFDGDLMFLMSFHEFLREVPMETKLTTRLAIGQAISYILANPPSAN